MGAGHPLSIGIGGIVSSMVALWFLWLGRPAPVSVVVFVVTAWGGLVFWNSPAIQARLYVLAGAVAPQALALNTSGTYLGVSIGAAVGGVYACGKWCWGVAFGGGGLWSHRVDLDEMCTLPGKASPG